METISPEGFNTYILDVGKVYALEAPDYPVGYSFSGAVSSQWKTGAQALVAAENLVKIHGAQSTTFTITEVKGRTVPADPASALQGRDVTLNSLTVEGMLDVAGAVNLTNASVLAPNAGYGLTHLQTFQSALLGGYYSTALAGNRAGAQLINHPANTATTTIWEVLSYNSTPIVSHMLTFKALNFTPAAGVSFWYGFILLGGTNFVGLKATSSGLFAVHGALGSETNISPNLASNLTGFDTVNIRVFRRAYLDAIQGFEIYINGQKFAYSLQGLGGSAVPIERTYFAISGNIASSQTLEILQPQIAYLKA